MGTTLANGIWVPGAREPVDWHVTPTIMGAAAGLAISGRSDGQTGPLLLVAANATEADAIKATPRRIGDQIHRTDLQRIEELQDVGWRVVKTFLAVDYTPAWAASSELVPGNGVSSFAYWVDGDRITVIGSFRFGTTSSISANVLPLRIPVPVEFPMLYSPANIGAIGRFYGFNDNAGAFHGQVMGMWGNYSDSDDTTGLIYPRVIIKAAESGFRVTRGMSSTFPAVWDVGLSASNFSVNFTYQTG